jgi:hypothetical protein
MVVRVDSFVFEVFDAPETIAFPEFIAALVLS